jgi:alkylation response protein AidB-like acyl-CoA dehydrogenase
LAPDITAPAAEIEAGRRIPLDLVEALRSIGVFRMFVPQSHGGLELDLPEGSEIIAAFSKIEGSVGWIAMNASVGEIFAPLRRPTSWSTQNGPDVILAGSIQPAETAEATAGGSAAGGRSPAAVSMPTGPSDFAS